MNPGGGEIVPPLPVGVNGYHHLGEIVELVACAADREGVDKVVEHFRADTLYPCSGGILFHVTIPIPLIHRNSLY